MKVFGCPEELPEPQLDIANYDRDAHFAREDEHKAKLKAWLIEQGYTGKHTGEIAQFGVADGYAIYMIADGRTSCLIHLAYGDGYNYRDIEYLPKAEIIKRAAQYKAMCDMFAARKKENASA